MYLISNGVKRWVTSPAAMDKYYFAWNRVYGVPFSIRQFNPERPEHLLIVREDRRFSSIWRVSPRQLIFLISSAPVGLLPVGGTVILSGLGRCVISDPPGVLNDAAALWVSCYARGPGIAIASGDSPGEWPRQRVTIRRASTRCIGRSISLRNRSMLGSGQVLCRR